MNVKVSGTLSGTVVLPASKSQAHRLLICSALSGEKGRLECSSLNDDIEITVSCLNALGADIRYENNFFDIVPIDRPVPGAALQCVESGSTLRFLLPVAAVLGADAVFDGHQRLARRPLSPLYEQIKAHGVALGEAGRFPLTCKGRLTGGSYSMVGNVSSQFISGLLFALPLAGEDSHLQITGPVESRSYIDMTVHALETFGIVVTRTGNGFFIPGGQAYHTPSKLAVEGDWSAAAFWLTAGAVGSGKIHCMGLDYRDSLQGDRVMADILRNMGARIEETGEGLSVFSSELHGISTDCADIPDLVPALSVAAACAGGTTVFHNISRLRLKESDRVGAICDMLGKFGISTEAAENTLTVFGGKPHRAVIDSRADHRIAMSAAIMATVAGGESIIECAGCVTKSYPTFFNDYIKLGGSADVIGVG